MPPTSRHGNSKKSDARVEVLVSALRAGNTRRAATAYAEVSAETFYRWLNEDVKFRDAVEKAEADAEARAVAIVIRAAQGGTWQAAAWWLERRKSADYALRQKIEFTVDMEEEARRIAADTGLDTASLVAEAERIASGR